MKCALMSIQRRGSRCSNICPIELQLRVFLFYLLSSTNLFALLILGYPRHSCVNLPTHSFCMVQHTHQKLCLVHVSSSSSASERALSHGTSTRFKFVDLCQVTTSIHQHRAASTFKRSLAGRSPGLDCGRIVLLAQLHQRQAAWFRRNWQAFVIQLLVFLCSHVGHGEPSLERKTPSNKRAAIYAVLCTERE